MKCNCIRPWMSSHISPDEIAVCCQQQVDAINIKKHDNLKDLMSVEYRDFRIAMLESSKENKLPEKYCNLYCSMKINIEDYPDSEVKREIHAGNVDYFAPLDITLVTDFLCNLQCKMCYIFEGVDLKSKTSKIYAMSVIDDMKEYDNSKLVVLGGEPQYSDHAKEITKYAIDNNIDIGFISNFTIFDQDIFDKINDGKINWTKISANSASKETRKLIMGDSFNKFIINVEKFLNWKHEYQKYGNIFDVDISFVIMTSNYHEIINAIDLYLKYPVYLKFMVIDHFYDGRYEEAYTLRTHQNSALSILLKAVQYVNKLIDKKDFNDTEIPCQMDIEKFRINQLNEIKNSLIFNINCLNDIIKNENNFDEALFDIEIIKKKSTKRLLK